MNLPNRLTILRAIMIPFFIYFLMTDSFEGVSAWVALALFCIASFTDFLDGKIARKYNLVTNFGKFMDPVADKLLVCSALICFVELTYLPAWMVIIIVARELIIMGFRTVAADKGVVIAAGWWGKIKTVFQMILIIGILLLRGTGREMHWNGMILNDRFDMTQTVNFTEVGLAISVIAWISIALTVVSLADYIIKNRAVLKETK